MRARFALLGALLLFSLRSTLACTCGPVEPPLTPVEQLRLELERNPAVVLVELLGQERKTWSLAFSAEHLMQQVSPWRGAEFLTLRVLRSWSPGLLPGQELKVRKVDGATCGYEAWERERQHLLFLQRWTWWTAGLCGLSAPASEAGDTLALLRQLKLPETPAVKP